MLCFALPCSLVAQKAPGPLVSDPPKGVSIPAIIQSFAAKEKEFKLAREQYTYTREVTVTASCLDRKPGVYHLIVDVTFDKKGNRVEKVKAVSSTPFFCVYFTKEDLEFFRNQTLLVLTTDEIQDYQINFIGQQQDDSHLYVFDVSPVATTTGKANFEGRIWVDGGEYRIVKSQGTIMTKREKKRSNQGNLLPAVTTWREQIDGRCWFPTYSRAHDVLHVSGDDVQIDEIVKLTNFKAIGH